MLWARCLLLLEIGWKRIFEFIMYVVDGNGWMGGCDDTNSGSINVPPL